MFFFPGKMIQDLCRIQSALFSLLIQKLRHRPVKVFRKIFRTYVIADLIEQTLFLDHPCQQCFLRQMDSVFLFLFHAICTLRSHHRSRHSRTDCCLRDHLIQTVPADPVCRGNRFNIIITFQFIFKGQKPSRYFSEELCLPLR